MHSGKHRFSTVDRRSFLATGLAAMLARPEATVANAIRPANDFVESVGVCAHIGSKLYGYTFDQFADLLRASGVRHLRFDFRPGSDLRALRNLHDRLGIRYDLLMSPTKVTVPQIVGCVKVLGPHCVSAIEGQNEADSNWFRSQSTAGGDWAGTVVEFQREMFQALRLSYPGSKLPILSPTVLDWKPRDMQLLRPAAGFCDVVAIHSYVQHGQEPETDDNYSGLGWYLRNMRDSFKPGAPVMVTETGYNNLVGPGGAGVSEQAAAIYLPRLMLNNFCAGVLRTYLYELMDDGDQPRDWEHHWGLVRHDGTPKPAYHAINALITALADDGPAMPSKPRDTRPMRVSLPAAPPELRSQVFRKRDGSLVLALWRAIRCWDVPRAADLGVAPRPVSVISDRPTLRVSRLIPNDGGDWADLPVHQGMVTVQLGEKVVLLRLTEG
jgi:hypothetical protein